jgi:hypothetical protein
MNNQEYSFREVVQSDTKRMAIFLNEVFEAKKFSELYLNNLYFGESKAIGLNVFYKNQIVAHYCILIREYTYMGKSVKFGWSLNTAVSSVHRGKGFFENLARQTYELAKNNGVDAIVGVANRNSTRLFINKLSFKDLGNVSWNLDFFATYNERLTKPKQLTHLKWQVYVFKGSIFLKLLPFMKIFSDSNKSFFSVYLTSRKRIKGCGITLPQNWFKSNWQVIALNLLDKGERYVLIDDCLTNLTIDIGESDTF